VNIVKKRGRDLATMNTIIGPLTGISKWNKDWEELMSKYFIPYIRLLRSTHLKMKIFLVHFFVRSFLQRKAPLR
jgi:ABC-type amino acid transport system permease subunit